jgi:uncharacterized protein YprB with RNaseH-like and TPR domain
VDSLLPGSWLASQGGRVYVASETYAPDHVHGLDPLGELLSLEPWTLAQLCQEPALAGVDLASAVFLDTETTGLSPGSGTLVFMVGLLYYRDGRFHARQFFLDSPDSERAMLASLTDLLSEFEALVTFNGKAFDVPMLETRYAFSGVHHDLGRLAHADMLFPARRLWKERLQSCRLATLEWELLGLGRTGDVHGSLIPGLYRGYLAGSDARPLLPVFYHNLQDLLSLLAVTIHAAKVYADPYGGRVQSGLDFLSLGRLYERAGELDRALRAYDRASSLPMHPAAREQLCKRLTPLYRRGAQVSEAVAMWEGMLASGELYSIYPLEELAKHYEHTERRYDRAEALVRQALALLPYDPCTRTTRRDLEKKLRRIQGKLQTAPTPT